MRELDVAAVLEDTVARQEITHAIARLQRGIDRADRALLNSAFHDDAELDYGFFVGSASDFCDIMTGPSERAHHEVTMHRPTNIWIRIDGERAVSESYIIAYSPGAGDDGPLQSLIGGRYLDRHECRDGAWRLVHRTYVLDWNINRAGTGSALPDFGAGLIRGARLEDDPGSQLLSSWAIADPPGNTGGTTVEISQELAAQAGTAFAKNEINDLIVAESRAVDRADEALQRSLWHPGATVDLGSFFEGSAEEFCDWILDVARSSVRMSHTVSNQWIQVDGAQAVAETYVIALSTVAGDDGDLDTLTGGRYLDRFEEIDGAWKFTHRTFVHDWQIDQPSTDQRDDPDGMYAALKTRGGHFPDDPVYAFWNQA